MGRTKQAWLALDRPWLCWHILSSASSYEMYLSRQEEMYWNDKVSLSHNISPWDKNWNILSVSGSRKIEDYKIPFQMDCSDYSYIWIKTWLNGFKLARILDILGEIACPENGSVSWPRNWQNMSVCGPSKLTLPASYLHNLHKATG